MVYIQPEGFLSSASSQAVTPLPITPSSLLSPRPFKGGNINGMPHRLSNYTPARLSDVSAIPAPLNQPAVDAVNAVHASASSSASSSSSTLQLVNGNGELINVCGSDVNTILYGINLPPAQLIFQSDVEAVVGFAKVDPDDDSRSSSWNYCH